MQILENDNIDERNERVVKRAFKPKEDILQYLLTHDYTESIRHHDEIMNNIIENPIETYVSFKDRIEKKWL
jgi:hypothetical protein